MYASKGGFDIPSLRRYGNRTKDKYFEACSRFYKKVHSSNTSKNDIPIGDNFEATIAGF